MSFEPKMYKRFIAANSPAQQRLIRQYKGTRTDFDIVIVGSGVGGGVLADALAQLAKKKSLRILVLEAGSFLYPTHVYNLCRFLNHRIAKRFGCRTFKQPGGANENGKLFIGERPQLNFGGRSIFWSGLIPKLQPWELNFFPPKVRKALPSLLEEAGNRMNQAVSMGRVAEKIVERLSNSWLAADFLIEQTPRALHQPYLQADGTLKDDFFTEPTGVFNTAELLINQLGLYPGTTKDNDFGIHLLLNHFVEDLQKHNGQWDVIVRDTVKRKDKTFQADKVVLAGGSIESPKLLLRSKNLFRSLPPEVQKLVGSGLTDHPTTHESVTYVDGIGGIDITPEDHFKIVLYSRGLREADHEIRYPFNVEMNLNHEYWHLRKNDPADPTDADRFGDPPKGKSALDIKFSFGNCLDDQNEVKAASRLDYQSEIIFHNLKRVDRLESRFRALAGWNKKRDEIWDVLNDITGQIFSLFRIDGKSAKPERSFGNGNKDIGFGYGTVHHAAGSLRMPWYGGISELDKAPSDGVVDKDLQVNGAKNLYVCDMSVMPICAAANPVRALVALALRLSKELAK